MSGSDGTSTEPGVAAVESMVVPEVLTEVLVAPTVVFEASIRAKSLSCHVSEVLTPISVASHSDQVVVRQIREDPRHKVGLTNPGQLKGMEIGLHLVVLLPDTIFVSGNPFY